MVCFDKGAYALRGEKDYLAPAEPPSRRVAGVGGRLWLEAYISDVTVLCLNSVISVEPAHISHNVHHKSTT